jgi:hypothetical protein
LKSGARILEGGCLCGAVRYRVTGEPLARTICHCRSCRLAGGAPTVAWAVFAPGDFEWLQGEPAGFASSPGVTRRFCGKCGTPLTYQHASRPDAIDLTTATFDQPELLPPTKEIWTEHRITWEVVNENLPQYPRSSLDTVPKDS